MEISVIGYDPVGAWHKPAATAQEALAWRNSGGVTWINADCLDDLDAVNALAEEYKIHPLTVEDVLDTTQRPKAEEFDNYLFITLKAVSPLPDLDFEHISLVITGDTVLSFQEKPGDYFDGVRKRILHNGGRIRRMAADYLAYALIDAVVDEYFAVLDRLGSGIEEFEDRAADEKDDTFIRDIQQIKRDLLRVRRVIWPLRESLSLLIRLESPRLSGELAPFLKDLYDHLIQAAETVETYRELVAGVMEVNLSAVSNRLNKVMKVLTIISTIFIPLTFIVGVYGMNFRYMPELEEPWAYPVIWGLMGVIALGMVVYFKRRHWM
ncbi:MAG: magnesium/cobalt transporter CorA [Treponema sp.]|jgi:magnesium transporter|nr:magnesium/cobalt transporter CorA [Treponema sp.]